MHAKCINIKILITFFHVLNDKHIAFFSSVVLYQSFIIVHERILCIGTSSISNALASLVQMIVTHWLTHRMEIDSPIPPQFSSLRLRHQPITQNGMSLLTECHSNGMSIKMECHSKWNGAQYGLSPRMECHSKLNFTQNKMFFKKESHST